MSYILAYLNYNSFRCFQVFSVKFKNDYCPIFTSMRNIFPKFSNFKKYIGIFESSYWKNNKYEHIYFKKNICLSYY